MADYDAVAAVYARYWGGPFHELALGAFDRLVAPALPPAARLLDIGCGCGHLAGLLLARGYHVVGVDASPAMVGCARALAPEARFLAGDARALPLRTRFDAALFTFDGLNHLLTRADLAAAFAAVRQVLRPGARFFFDVLLEDAYRDEWDGSLSLVGDDHACFVRGGYDPATRLGRTELTVFGRANGGWQRSDVTIRQRCHAPDDLLAAARAAGFARLERCHAQTDLGSDAVLARGRLFCAAHADG